MKAVIFFGSCCLGISLFGVVVCQRKGRQGILIEWKNGTGEENAVLLQNLFQDARMPIDAEVDIVFESWAGKWFTAVFECNVDLDGSARNVLPSGPMRGSTGKAQRIACGLYSKLSHQYSAWGCNYPKRVYIPDASVSRTAIKVWAKPWKRMTNCGLYDDM